MRSGHSELDPDRPCALHIRSPRSTQIVVARLPNMASTAIDLPPVIIQAVAAPTSPTMLHVPLSIHGNNVRMRRAPRSSHRPTHPSFNALYVIVDLPAIPVAEQR